MIDLHTHTFFSDGVLIASELVYRAKVKGYKAIAITDHGDFSNLDFIIPRIKKASKDLSACYGITVLAGIEITYVPPDLISKAVHLSRKLGADIVVIHGEPRLKQCLKERTAPQSFPARISWPIPAISLKMT